MDKKQKRAPSKSYQEGIGIFELMKLFKDEDMVWCWLESIILKDGEAMCHRCNGIRTCEVKNSKPLQHKCRDCRKLFSVRHGLIFEGSHTIEKMGDCDFSGCHKSQRLRQHEASQSIEYHSEISLVHVAQNTRSICTQRRIVLRRG